MKSVMYHYVRSYDKNYPKYNFLNKKKFKDQISLFSKAGIISHKKEIFSSNNKYLLTFDDGLKDHIWVAEELKKNNCIGIFFISSSPLQEEKIQDVHKIHLILGKIDSLLAIEELKKFSQKNGLKFYSQGEITNNNKWAYKDYDDEETTKIFKRIMNFNKSLKDKEKVLNHLLNFFEIKTTYKNYYMSKKEIKYISELGMLIGSHGHSHNLLSNLSYNFQLRELKRSKKFLENFLKKECNIFCYPYGGVKSYNANTLKILKKLNYNLAFSLGNRDIKKNDILKKPLELPRYDCNQFI